jgi:hypothetical protein
MGQEIACRAHFAGKSYEGKVLLESKEILFRGGIRLKIPVASIKEIKAVNGVLQVKTSDGLAAFDLGARAEKWRDKILNPKSVIEKLGVKPGDAVVLYGGFEKHFHDALKQHGAKIGKAGNVLWIFFHAQARAELSKVKAIADGLKGATALWLVYPKVQKAITEGDVREAGLKQGLKDVKVASFSDTHTALKFVVPRAKR